MIESSIQMQIRMRIMEINRHKCGEDKTVHNGTNENRDGSDCAAIGNQHQFHCFRVTVDRDSVLKILLEKSKSTGFGSLWQKKKKIMNERLLEFFGYLINAASIIGSASSSMAMYAYALCVSVPKFIFSAAIQRWHSIHVHFWRSSAK